MSVSSVSNSLVLASNMHFKNVLEEDFKRGEEQLSLVARGEQWVEIEGWEKEHVLFFQGAGGEKLGDKYVTQDTDIVK